MRLRARVPATVANLGPGFDALALAVDVQNEVEVDTEARPAVVVEGEGAGELPEDASNLVVRSMAYLAREAGGPLPPFGLRCRNGIPLERGLGSSAAATVAGLLLANELIGSRLDLDGLLEVAVDIEGHPDNVAACLFGSLVLAYLSREGWRAERLEPHESLRPVLFVPEEERVPTADARRVLPREVPLSDAAHNVGRTALAVVALTIRPHLLLEALEDRLHQARRLALAPASRALYQDLRDAGLAVCVAGAGPSLLAFETDAALVPELGPGWRILRPRIAEGATLTEL
ncbi:MAG TPA: homoserine kinase [Actinomycetota bacterium]|jgi:homoserine kinase|nr:homoserine kinase [Actinomycetota bacterium]